MSKLLGLMSWPELKPCLLHLCGKLDCRLVEGDRDDYPTWSYAGDRKLVSQLQKRAIVQPNSTMAKDVSGQYKTVTYGSNVLGNV